MRMLSGCGNLEHMLRTQMVKAAMANSNKRSSQGNDQGGWKRGSEYRAEEICSIRMEPLPRDRGWQVPRHTHTCTATTSHYSPITSVRYSLCSPTWEEKLSVGLSVKMVHYWARGVGTKCLQGRVGAVPFMDLWVSEWRLVGRVIGLTSTSRGYTLVCCFIIYAI